MTAAQEILYRRVRWLLGLFMVGLIISGLTAIPLQWGAHLLQTLAGAGTWVGERWPAVSQWVEYVAAGIRAVSAGYPFMFYGTDWLAFAHIVIGIAFIGPLRDPVKNIWVVELGIIASILVIPTALIAGPLRGIPFFWRLIDCSFGGGGLALLLPAHWLIRKLAQAEGKLA
ncbi:MAG: hypothetical protein CVU38_09550 [Chloroflexi bacterium HGW-Chloroflexi-1]|nr:MAG: hypothetical protein CVU38_09550 [Chloroflexi bacterium HGW-Chloroflexi-1]